jgi:hypothetical protein
MVVGLLLVILVLVFWIISLQSRLRRAGLGSNGGLSFLVTADVAQAGARKGFSDYGLLARADWAPHIGGRAVERTPLLVRRLDQLDPARSHYYLVPVGVSDDAISAVARVDAVTGKYLEVKPFAPRGDKGAWGPRTLYWLTEMSTRQHIARGDVGRSSNQKRLTVADSSKITVYPTFVWRPCVESASPFYPFRLVSIDGEIRYIRIDGHVFTSLTNLGPQPTSSEPNPTAYGSPPDSRSTAD